MLSDTKTSNEYLHTLQRWMSVGPEPLLLALNNLTSLSRKEGTRNMLQLFNALFDVMGSYSSYFKVSRRQRRRRLLCVRVHARSVLCATST